MNILDEVWDDFLYYKEKRPNPKELKLTPQREELIVKMFGYYAKEKARTLKISPKTLYDFRTTEIIRSQASTILRNAYVYENNLKEILTLTNENSKIMENQEIYNTLNKNAIMDLDTVFKTQKNKVPGYFLKFPKEMVSLKKFELDGFKKGNERKRFIAFVESKSSLNVQKDDFKKMKKVIKECKLNTLLKLNQDDYFAYISKVAMELGEMIKKGEFYLNLLENKSSLKKFENIEFVFIYDGGIQFKIDKLFQDENILGILRNQIRNSLHGLNSWKLTIMYVTTDWAQNIKDKLKNRLIEKKDKQLRKKDEEIGKKDAELVKKDREINRLKRRLGEK